MSKQAFNPFTANLDLGGIDNGRLANLCGKLDEHIQLIEAHLSVIINNRAGCFQFSGSQDNCQCAVKLIETLYQETKHRQLDLSQIHLHLQQSNLVVMQSRIANDGPAKGHLHLAGKVATDTDTTNNSPAKEAAGNEQKNSAEQIIIGTKRGSIKPRGWNQIHYIKQIRQKDISFGVGPAGTGKTFLAVACAVEALLQNQVTSIVLVRPAVEAGEKLGFLPGDLAQKIDPYLTPLYDALYEMLGFEKVCKLIEKNIIEVAPLAYMRGRTLNDAFIILDESQNTTIEQMKMFLTRLGFGSKAVITGDITQVDLPKGKASGLKHAIQVLASVEDINFSFFSHLDVVRHVLVQRIVQAYECFD